MSESGDVSQQEMAQLQQMAYGMLEEQIFAWFGDLRTQVQSKRDQDWRSGDRATQAAARAADAGKTDVALQGAIDDVNQGLLRLLGVYVEQHSNPQMDTGRLTSEVQRFVRQLHNPETREALLLAVQPEHREDVRGWFDQIGSMIWGMIDLSQGRPTEDFWFLVDVLAAMQGRDLDAIVAQVDGVSMGDVPDEIRR